MMTRPLFFACALLLPLSLIVGCEGEVNEATGGSGGAGASGGSGGSGAAGGGTGAAGGGTGAAGGGTGAAGGGTGGGPNSGDCDTDADCPGSTCVEITPGGFRVCKSSYLPVDGCSQPDLDECCNSTECPSGEACLAAPLTPYCGGPAPLEYNVCGKDQCSSAADCPNGICAPTGTLGNKVRACYSGSCLVDSDCSAAPGGICAPVVDPCCNQPVGLFCVYPGGCRTASDCDQGEYCQIQPNGSTECVVGDVACPA